jgi:hypothetical protein
LITTVICIKKNIWWYDDHDDQLWYPIWYPEGVWCNFKLSLLPWYVIPGLIPREVLVQTLTLVVTMVLACGGSPKASLHLCWESVGNPPTFCVSVHYWHPLFPSNRHTC